jgi:hypothetical protein
MTWETSLKRDQMLLSGIVKKCKLTSPRQENENVVKITDTKAEEAISHLIIFKFMSKTLIHVSKPLKDLVVCLSIRQPAWYYLA